LFVESDDEATDSAEHLTGNSEKHNNPRKWLDSPEIGEDNNVGARLGNIHSDDDKGNIEYSMDEEEEGTRHGSKNRHLILAQPPRIQKQLRAAINIAFDRVLVKSAYVLPDNEDKMLAWCWAESFDPVRDRTDFNPTSACFSIVSGLGLLSNISKHLVASDFFQTSQNI